MSPSKRLAIRLPDHIYDRLDLAADDSLSGRVAAICDRYRVIIETTCPRLTRAEWLLILDACNGWAAWATAGETLMTGIAIEVADHCRLNGAAEKWNLSPAAAVGLVDRLRHLDPAETMAIIERIERFWRHSDLDTDAALAAADIQPID